MLYVDTPTLPDFKALNAKRADACVSIYVPTTPVTSEIEKARIKLGNLVKEGIEQLQAKGFDKRRLATLGEALDDLLEDDEFWRVQANSLAVFATPDSVRTYRLANKLEANIEVSDRFHLKPLLRAITFPHSAFVLALSENNVRLIETFSDLPPQIIRVPDLPSDAASALGRSTLNDRSAKRRITGSEGQKVRLTQFARMVDTALRPVLSGRETPLIIAATDPMASIFRSVCTYSHLLPDTITSTNDRSTEGEIAQAAIPVLDKSYEAELAEFAKLFKQRSNEGRAISDISDAAKAATFGAIDTLVVDIDEVVHGAVDEETGAVSFDKEETAANYGVVDEIMGRALNNGARVLGARKSDIPGGKSLAAVLRYAL
ncbi:baeRF11 domain-containing protein [Pelagibacterium lentulum]|uniref:Uncharacterized protein n=1 Tax=Pelagibacterium lentulum TaxID=2029865 RepID=A0A916VX43_9HYPH|nr:hypothetical protein [Pelagibacterium lentulum]GGA47899.1 hypothetical protein GCM10011499_17190 [Pelagibacterium lentulum]